MKSFRWIVGSLDRWFVGSLWRHRRTRGERRDCGRFPRPLLFVSREPPEETGWLPPRSRGMVGDFYRQRADQPCERHGRPEIEWLLQVVRGAVIPLFCPPGVDFGLRRGRGEPDLERQRGNALANEAVLIGSRETIAFRLGIHV